MIASSLCDRVLVIGEALIDIVEHAGEVERHVGGSPLNVAFGLGRLGVPTTFATEFGDDADGAAISAHLTAADVSVVRTADTDAPTSTARAQIGPDGSASYTFEVEWTFRYPPTIEGVRMVHVGSIGALRAPGSAGVLAFIEALPEDVLVSFDPNIRPALLSSREEARTLVERYAARAEIVKLSDEDAEWLYPGRADATPDILLSGGARLVAITRGAEGSTLHSPVASASIAARPVPTIDTIGAGDAYMSGLLAALTTPSDQAAVLSGLTSTELATIGRIAAASAALTVGRAGAMPPTSGELIRAIRTPPPRLG